MSSKWVAAAACAIAGAVLRAGRRDRRADRRRRGRDVQGPRAHAADQMPSGRVVSPTATNATNFGYRTYDQINAEMAGARRRQPGLVKIKTAARKSVEGRDVKYLEITNNVDWPSRRQAGLLHTWARSTATSGPPASTRWSSSTTSSTRPRRTRRSRRCFDKRRMIVMPVVNSDGLVRFRRANCGGAVAPAPCPT